MLTQSGFFFIYCKLRLRNLSSTSLRSILSPTLILRMVMLPFSIHLLINLGYKINFLLPTSLPFSWLGLNISRFCKIHFDRSPNHVTWCHLVPSFYSKVEDFQHCTKHSGKRYVIIICLNFGYRTPEKKRLTFILGPVPSCRARCKYLFKIYLPRNLGNDT